MYKTRPALKKRIEKRLGEMKYNIIIWDCNGKAAKTYNVFANCSFFRSLSDTFVNELYLCYKEGRAFNRKTVESEIMSAAAYCFWAKYEYEIDVCQHFHACQEDATVFDGYAQMEMNKDIVLDYIISNLLECVGYADAKADVIK